MIPSDAGPGSRDSVILVFGTAVAAILSIGYLVMVGRILGPAEFAQFAAASSLAALVAYALGGITLIVGKRSSEYAARGEPAFWRRVIDDASRRVWIASAVGLVGVFLVAEPLRRFLRFDSQWTIAIAYAMIVFLVSISIVRAGLRGAHRFASHSTSLMLESLLRIVIGALLVTARPGADAALAAYPASSLLAFLFVRHQVASIAPRSAAEALPREELRSVGVASFVVVFVMACVQNIDMLLVKRVFASHEAGYYAAALSIARAIAFATMPFDALLIPLVVHARERSLDLTRAIGRVVAACLGLAAIPLILFALWPDAIVRLLYGPEFGAAAGIVLLLAVALLGMYLTYFSGQILIALGHSRFVAIAAVALALEILLLLRFHDSLWQVSAIVATINAAAVAGYLVVLVPMLTRLRREPAS